jgi:hypothetical protein
MSGITPINEFEAVFEPFWDPDLSGLKRWSVADGQAYGLRVWQYWCWASFEWTGRPADGPALSMIRRFGIDCSGYDRLLVSAVVPRGAVLAVRVGTDAGERAFRSPPSDVAKQEYAVDLGGATRIDEVSLEVLAGDDGPAGGWFNWIGLQDSSRLAGHLRRRERLDPRWEGYLRPKDYDPRFEPSYGLVLSSQDLEDLRRWHQGRYGDPEESPFVQAGRAAAANEPERWISEYVNFWSDTRYNRQRDHGKHLLGHGLNAAMAGHLLRDKSLLRLAGRYAMSIAMCEHWDDGFICRFPGSGFDHRCFVQSLCAHEVAAILDLAGEVFTSRGRQYLLRRLAEEGVGTIQYNTWRYEYIFGCNQLAWFTPGRMLALAVLQRHWPRVAAYRRIAYDELIESLQATILPDGGYVEGPTYFRCVGRDAGLGLHYFGRSEGQDLAAVAPQAMRRCGDFAEALASTDQAADMIPICDARNIQEPLVLAVMARLLPDSAWARLLGTRLQDPNWMNRSPIGGSAPNMLDQAIAWRMAQHLELRPPPPRPLVCLPEMGLLASHRFLGDLPVKLLILGNKAGTGHAHEDKGSFVLELAGQTFAMDPGTCDYSNPLAGMLKHCQRHNMLVPAGLAERPCPDNPLPADVKPSGAGDQQGFSARIDLTPGWKRYYRRWRRTWDSPSPDRLTIRDEYELQAGQGVEFYWQTRLPVSIHGRTATIEGRRGLARIEWPADCTARLDELPLADGVQNRLAVCKPGREGVLEINVTLSPR